MKVTEFDVKRSTWLHGEGSQISALFRPTDEKMCCLGYFCVAAGCDINDLSGVQVPSDLEGDCKEAIAAQLLMDAPTEDPSLKHLEVVNKLMLVNDKQVNYPGDYTETNVTSEEDREQKITALFAEMGVKVNFVD